MARKLKVYRTPIGFHDAYVAAWSQKEALKAWGSSADLFARGAADTVTDDELTREPLASPGTVVRRLRGTNDEHIAALPDDKPAAKRRVAPPDDDEVPSPRRRDIRPPRRKASAGAASKASDTPEAAADDKPAKRKPSPKTRAKAHPSRAAMDDAERLIAEAAAEHAAASADLRQRESALRQERRELERLYEDRTAKLEASLGEVRDRYRAALAKWSA